MTNHYPEGRLVSSEENKRILSDTALMLRAAEDKTILEARALMCTAAHDMVVELPHAVGIIPRREGALGIAEGTVRDIAMLARVGKTVCFTVESADLSGDVPVYTLSRARAQRLCTEEYISRLTAGDVIPATVTHLEPFGAFVDIGCGISSMIPIDAISVSRIAHPNDRFYNGQRIFAVVKAIEDGRVFLTHKELLGTWEQNAANFEVGAVVRGIVRSIESYGVFIEVAPNLAGLAEPHEGLTAGKCVSVGIKSIKPDKMKLKLAVVDTLGAPRPLPPMRYYIRSGHIDRWQYSPEGSSKTVVTDFTAEVGTVQ